jgi:cell fate (sporulation/competence/biofilm development) regulator YlbF (YheA/YmcA/DUF963 family)
MFEKIKDETSLLVKKIKKTQEYIDYLNYKSILERDEELYRQTQEFRRKSFEIQASHHYGFYNAYENLVNLKNENENLLCEPKVKLFLDAELKISKLISAVYDTIAEDIDFDIRFLD